MGLTSEAATSPLSLSARNSGGPPYDWYEVETLPLVIQINLLEVNLTFIPALSNAFQATSFQKAKVQLLVIVNAS